MSDYRLSHTPFNTRHDLPFGAKVMVLQVGAVLPGGRSADYE